MTVLSSSQNPGREKKLFEFTSGVDVDAHLCKQEVQVQKAWIDALCAIDVLSKDEATLSQSALDEALDLMNSGQFKWRVDDEDIHMNLERFLVEKVGETGKRVHLGRSRNDLIATTLRIFVKDTLKEVEELTAHLLLALCRKAESLASVIVPGMTHLQHGQPIRFGHILSAHGWAFSRDLEKLEFTQGRVMATMPLGSAALAGTTIPVDLEKLAQKLGFKSPTLNSYDSVGDRDFIVESLDCFSSIAVHLSRLSEDLIIGSSTAIGLIKLPPNWSTGSSIMPNKRNPDVPELIRAKSAHLMAASANAHFLLKGMPSSYNSDLHELKGVFIRATKEAKSCLEILEKFILEIEIDERRAQDLLKKGNLLATEVANSLAMQGIPFREAYQQTAALVKEAETQKVSIEELDSATLTKLSPRLDQNLMSHLDYEYAIESRNLSGGTALKSTLSGIESLKAIARKHCTA